MGKCKVNDTFLGRFTWARRIPGDLFHVKCNVCAISKPISVEKGAQSWTQHENTAAHKAALQMGGVTAQTIERSLAPSVGIGTANRKATILHVINLVLQKHSFRTSDPFSRRQGLYAKRFPDSAFTSINCGKTKIKYIAVHGLAPYQTDLCVNKDDSRPGIAISKAINCMQLQLIATLGHAISISNYQKH